MEIMLEGVNEREAGRHLRLTPYDGDRIHVEVEIKNADGVPHRYHVIVSAAELRRAAQVSLWT